MAEQDNLKTNALCIGSGCSRSSWARGMCKTHYSRWRIHGDCEVMAVRRLPSLCEVEGCSNKPHTRWKKERAVCNVHWQNLYRYGKEQAPQSAPLNPLPLCSVHKCRAEARSRTAAYCEKHYYRVRRGSNLESDPTPLHRYVTKAGYVVLVKNEHPLAKGSGRVSEHRVVAYEKHGGECPDCYWCGKALAWKTAVIDHLNEIKSDNRPENLLVACNSCNRARGALLPFVAAMKPEAVKGFFDSVLAYRRALNRD